MKLVTGLCLKERSVFTNGNFSLVNNTSDE